MFYPTSSLPSLYAASHPQSLLCSRQWWGVSLPAGSSGYLFSGRKRQQKQFLAAFFCSSFATCCPGSGAGLGSHAVTKIIITIQVKKNANTSFPGEGHFCFQSKTCRVSTCILASSGKGWQTGCRNEQLHVEGSRKNVISLPKEVYHASAWLLKLDRASPRSVLARSDSSPNKGSSPDSPWSRLYFHIPEK